jgi:DNA-binding NtrC family response regulator
MAARILVAEDEEITLRHILETLQGEGYRATGTGNGREALQLLGRGFDILIADIRMPGMSGIELLSSSREKFPETDVIIITGYGSIGSAVEAMRMGAHDYITKPFELDDLLQKIKKVLEAQRLKRQVSALRSYAALDRQISIIASSSSMKEVLDTVEGIRDSDCNVLLTGESGVGKGLLAKIIHYTSRRAGQKNPFLSLNCATLTEELLASELFGYERGAFTGAVRSKPGLVEIADTGTLFLDEIAEMPPNLQAKLLKLIEDGEFYRVGGTKPLKVDVRFIASTNRRVSENIEAGKFREDLYYRLNVVSIVLPPLREHKEDIPYLVDHFLARFANESAKRITGITPAAMKMLKDFHWPGNIRELENIIERAVALSTGTMLDVADIRLDVGRSGAVDIPSMSSGDAPGPFLPSGMTLEQYEDEIIKEALRRADGNKSQAARLLGLSRNAFRYRLSKLGVPDEPES